MKHKSVVAGIGMFVLIYFPLSIFFPLIQLKCTGVGQNGAFCGTTWGMLFGGLGVSPLALLTTLIILATLALISRKKMEE